MTRDGLKALNLNCTRARHLQLGAHAPINAKICEQWRNDPSDGYNGKHDGYIDLLRDSDDLRRILNQRVRVYQFRTRWFRRRFAHLLARHDD